MERPTMPCPLSFTHLTVLERISPWLGVLGPLTRNSFFCLLVSFTHSFIHTLSKYLSLKQGRQGLRCREEKHGLQLSLSQLCRSLMPLAKGQVLHQLDETDYMYFIDISLGHS